MTIQHACAGFAKSNRQRGFMCIERGQCDLIWSQRRVVVSGGEDMNRRNARACRHFARSSNGTMDKKLGVCHEDWAQETLKPFRRHSMSVA